MAEPLESRLLFSETVTGQLNLLSTTGSGATTVYHYDITLKDTGTTKIGTFWFAWLPGEDFLPSVPTNLTSPASWSAQVFHSGGNSIQWIAQSPSAALTPGQTTTSFGFSSTDSPAVLSANAPSFPSNPTKLSEVYIAGPLTDAGDQFVVADAATPPPLTASQTTLATSAVSLSSGDPLTLTATITSTNGGATPTGTVTFLKGVTTLGSIAISNGSAAFTTSSLPIGKEVITAAYTGDNTYSSSKSTTLTETVTMLPHLAIVSQPIALTAGQTIPTLTVDAENSANKLDANINSDVTIAILTGPAGAVLGGTLTVPALNGEATFSDLSLTEAGNYTFKVTDNPVLPNHSTKMLTVTPDTSSSHLVLAKNPAGAVVGARLLPAVIVDVKDQFNNLISTDHSKVTLAVDTGPLGGAITGVLTATAVRGVATFGAISIRLAGSYTLSLTDATLAIATPLTFAANISQGVTTLLPPPVKASYLVGQTITLLATLHSTAPALIPFTGSATITDESSAVLSTATVTPAGALKFTLTPLAAGVYTCIVNYPGDINHTAKTSAAFVIHVLPAVTKTTLRVSPASITSGQPLTLTAVVNAPADPSGIPTGTIKFMDGKTVLDTITLDNTGTAQLMIADPTKGSHVYTAVYSSDSNFKTSTSPAKIVVVKAAI